MTGPPHDRIRRILQPWFGAGGVARVERDIEECVTGLLDEIEAGGDEFDAVADFSMKLIPRIMLGRMFGLDEERQAVFIRMGREMERVHQAVGYPTSYVAAFEETRAVVDGIIAERVAHPRADFFGDLVAGRDRGEPISDEEIFANVFAICAAAMTTTSTAAAATLLAWMRYRDQFELLTTEPELMGSAIDESLRWHPAGLFGTPRFVVEDTEVSGTRMRKDMVVHTCVAAADFDPEIYPDPLRFDIRRAPKQTMVFGAGAHYCAGGLFARKIVAVGLQEFMGRFPDLALVDSEFEPAYRGQLGEIQPTTMRMRLHGAVAPDPRTSNKH
jgi:cytochrome P450